MSDEQKPKGWLKTVPGILTAIAAIITAIAGLIVALKQVGVFGEKEKPLSQITQPSHGETTPLAIERPSAAPQRETEIAQEKGEPTADAFAQQSIRVQTVEIITFKQIQGQSQWRQSQLNRIAGAQWVFNPDGTFLLTMPNVRDDLYPIRGTYHESNGSLIFSGSSSSQIGSTGMAMVEISGRLYSQNNTSMISMSATSTSSSTAVIKGQSFSGGSTSAYEFTVTVK